MKIGFCFPYTQDDLSREVMLEWFRRVDAGREKKPWPVHSVQTTEIYLHTGMKRKREAVKSL